jgi:multicomponent Na+:H+ antiporter subunit F
MFAIVGIVLLVVMAMVLYRALLGPTLYDRILAVNNFGTKTVLLIAVAGFIGGRPEFLDIAIVYALVNFITLIAVLRFFQYSGRTNPEEETHGNAS